MAQAGRGHIDGDKIIEENRRRNSLSGSFGEIKNNTTGETVQRLSDKAPEAYKAPPPQQITPAEQAEQTAVADIYGKEEYQGGGDYEPQEDETMQGLAETIDKYNDYLDRVGKSKKRIDYNSFMEGVSDSDDLYEALDDIDRKIEALPDINIKEYYRSGEIKPFAPQGERLSTITGSLLQMIPPEERTAVQQQINEDDRPPLDQIIDIYNELSNNDNPIDPEMVYENIETEEDANKAFNEIEERISQLG